jgi:hypothetical protein
VDRHLEVESDIQIDRYQAGPEFSQPLQLEGYWISIFILVRNILRKYKPNPRLPIALGQWRK